MRPIARKEVEATHAALRLTTLSTEELRALAKPRSGADAATRKAARRVLSVRGELDEIRQIMAPQ